MKLKNVKFFDEVLPQAMYDEIERVSGMSIEEFAIKNDSMVNRAADVEKFLSLVNDEGLALLDTEGLEIIILSANELFELCPSPMFDRRNVIMAQNKCELYINIDMVQHFTAVEITGTIIHELAHVDQYLRGDLSVDSATMTAYWKGEAYNLAKVYTDMALTGNSEESLRAYHDLPWEIESHAMQAKYLIDKGVFEGLPESIDKTMMLEDYNKFFGIEQAIAA